MARTKTTASTPQAKTTATTKKAKAIEKTSSPYYKIIRGKDGSLKIKTTNYGTFIVEFLNDIGSTKCNEEDTELFITKTVLADSEEQVLTLKLSFKEDYISVKLLEKPENKKKITGKIQKLLIDEEFNIQPITSSQSNSLPAVSFQINKQISALLTYNIDVEALLSKTDINTVIKNILKKVPNCGLNLDPVPSDVKTVKDYIIHYVQKTSSKILFSSLDTYELVQMINYLIEQGCPLSREELALLGLRYLNSINCFSARPEKYNCKKNNFNTAKITYTNGNFGKFTIIL